MESPTPYYGGKTYVARWIISLFPLNYEKLSYVEPYAGGLSVFFKKKPSKIESISDINKCIFCFYRALRETPKELYNYIDNTTFSENDFKDAKLIYEGKKQATDMQKAWSFYALSRLSFGGNLSSFGFSKNRVEKHNYRPAVTQNKKDIINQAHKRIFNAQIFDRPALKMIEMFDIKTALFYLDPPYPKAEQGPYRGFTMKNFNDLLTRLKKIKGKFALSCYKKDGMNFHPNWNVYYKSSITCNAFNKREKNQADDRVECLVTNFKKYNSVKY